MNTIQLVFEAQGQEREILLAQLSEAGCSGFEETDTCLLAYVPEDDAAAVLEIARAANCPVRQSLVVEQNWNAAWEASFDPVVVPGFCRVRAPFHAPAHDLNYEIVIMPKMSFGTGHHATTRLMIQGMRELPFGGAEVLDFGTGTGILAVLATKLGAEHVVAIDTDEWSVRNAQENIAANDAGNVRVLQGSIEQLETGKVFDVVLANINRNVLLQSMPVLRARLKSDGVLLLSGILESDEQQVSAAAQQSGFILCESFNENGWICLKFTA
jgi:ribosomal protein L11 methyltransferase